jgi:hypothetical protein
MIDTRIIDQFNSRAPFKLEDATVLVLAQVGSHSHNTYIPKDDPQAIDDIDYMGIVVPPASFTFGVREWEGLNFQFEELDCVFYSFRKFMQLMIKSNPNVLGLTYLKPEHYVEQSKQWEMVLLNRHIFSSLAAYPAFTGYAFAQLQKMTAFDIKTQNAWDDALMIVETAGWTKEQVLEKKNRPMPNYEKLETINLIGKRLLSISPEETSQEIMNQYLENAAENLIKIHARHFQGYMGEKRKSLVRKYGYDTKNAAHLIRLMRMCNEFLEFGVFNVFRTDDAQEIRDIKSGKWTLEAVQTEANKLFTRAKEVKEISVLPESPNIEAIDQLAMYVYRSAYGYL